MGLKVKVLKSVIKDRVADDACPLAIVIPAFKPDFLEYTLQSLVDQTCKAFRVYIGDDGGSQDIWSTVRDFCSQLNIHYKRFETRFGKKSLVRHWTRCVDMTVEPYICILCDDDLLDRECVRCFLGALEDTRAGFDLYRFNSVIIDEDGSPVAYHGRQPIIESNGDFLIQRLRFKRVSFVSAYIFKRKAYNREGGFIDFPLAWYSDDASWIAMSRLTGIYTIDKAMVYWRQSKKNISNRSLFPRQKLKASMMYMLWIKRSLREGTIDSAMTDHDLCALLLDEWFFCQLRINAIEVKSLWRRLWISCFISIAFRKNAKKIFQRLAPQNGL